MIVFLFKRLGMTLLVAITVSVISFGVVFMSGDPAASMAGEHATQDQVERIRQAYGLDRPVAVQYLDWLGRVSTGDFGESFYFSKPVASLLADAIPVTATIAFLSLIVSILIAIPLGVIAAARANSAFDIVLLGLASIAQAVPTFWAALALMIFLSFTFPLLPASGLDNWRGYILPTLALSVHSIPVFVGLTRMGMLSVLQSDYIRTAHAKGASRTRVLYKHALRNAVVPMVSLMAVQLGQKLSGSIVVESIYGIHGLGLLSWQAIVTGDLPTVQAILMIFSVAYIVLVLIGDLLNAWLDPRIRVG
jgi:peptide/nickel transport system permease protein